MKKLRTLIAAALVAAPLAAAGQTLHLDQPDQFQYGDSSYSWNDPLAYNLPNEIFAVVGAGVALITRPAGYRRLALSFEAIGVVAARLKVGDYRARTFDATADIDTTPLVETMTITGGVAPHVFRAGDGPYKVSGTCPAGLSGTPLYFVEAVSSTAISFHLTKQQALAASTATRVDLGVAAVGTCTVGGMPAAPAASSTDGYESFGLMSPSQSTVGGSSNWPPVILWAPERLTISPMTAAKVITYWFLP